MQLLPTQNLRLLKNFKGFSTANIKNQTRPASDSTANCGNKSTNISRPTVADLTAKQQARIARNIDLLQSTNMRF